MRWREIAAACFLPKSSLPKERAFQIELRRKEAGRQDAETSERSHVQTFFAKEHSKKTWM